MILSGNAFPYGFESDLDDGDHEHASAVIVPTRISAFFTCFAISFRGSFRIRVHMLDVDFFSFIEDKTKVDARDA